MIWYGRHTSWCRAICRATRNEGRCSPKLWTGVAKLTTRCFTAIACLFSRPTVIVTACVWVQKPSMWWAVRLGFDSGQGIILSLDRFRGSSTLLSNWSRGLFPDGIKQPQLESGHSLSCTTDTKSLWSLSSAPTLLPATFVSRRVWLSTNDTRFSFHTWMDTQEYGDPDKKLNWFFLIYVSSFIVCLGVYLHNYWLLRQVASMVTTAV